MNDSLNHTTRNVVFVAAAAVALFVTAWIAQDVGFAIAIGLVLAGVIAVFVPFVFIYHDEHGLPRDSRHRQG